MPGGGGIYDDKKQLPYTVNIIHDTLSSGENESIDAEFDSFSSTKRFCMLLGFPRVCDSSCVQQVVYSQPGRRQQLFFMRAYTFRTHKMCRVNVFIMNKFFKK